MSQHFKQIKLYDPSDNSQQPKIYIYGLGSIGSHVTMALAKTGFKNITVYDYDTVEESNVPAQLYTITQAQEEKLKTTATKELVAQFTGTNIETVQGKIEESTELEIGMGGIHILCFDNIEARKLVAEKLNGSLTTLIDGRIGAWHHEIYTANNTDNSEYQQSLEGTFSELECGEKCLWGVNSHISSKINSLVLRIVKKQPIPKAIKGHYLSEVQVVKN